MKMMMSMVVCVTLSACATAPMPPVTATPTQVGPPLITPVGLDGLRGSQALIFPDIDVPTTVAAVEDYTARCLMNQDIRRISEPNGFALYSGPGEPYLRVVVASVSESSALGLGGTGLTDAMKEAIADTVQGRPRCAA